MPKISGTIVCEQCGEPINWEYIIPQHIDSPIYDVVEISANRSYAKLVGSSELCVRCKNCDSISIFPYSKG